MLILTYLTHIRAHKLSRLLSLGCVHVSCFSGSNPVKRAFAMTD